MGDDETVTRMGSRALTEPLTTVVVTRDGLKLVVKAHRGRSLMEALRDGGVGDVLALCGGCCSCGTCHVYVDGPWLPNLKAPAEDEQMLLGASSHLRDNSRLSCQIKMEDMLDGLRITVAPEE